MIYCKIVITGASTGIGRASAEWLAKHGHSVIACVRSEGDFNNLSNVQNITPFILDVNSEDHIRNLVFKLNQETQSQNLPLVLINNAGIIIGGPVECVPIHQWKEQFDVNVFGLIRVTQALLPFIRNSNGRVINMSSVAGLISTPGLGPYSASKFCVESISDTLRLELKKFGIKVVLIEPGPIATPIWEKSLNIINNKMKEWSSEITDLYFTNGGRLESTVQDMTQDSVAMSVFLKALAKAIHNKNPLERYLVSTSKLKFLLKLGRCILPTRLVDKVLILRYRL